MVEVKVASHVVAAPFTLEQKLKPWSVPACQGQRDEAFFFFLGGGGGGTDLGWPPADNKR